MQPAMSGTSAATTNELMEPHLCQTTFQGLAIVISRNPLGPSQVQRPWVHLAVTRPWFKLKGFNQIRPSSLHLKWRSRVLNLPEHEQTKLMPWFWLQANKQERKKGSPTFKDLDFMELLPEGLLLEAETYNALISTLRRDCRVLESFRIMDYSLLIGIHNLDLAAKEEVVSRDVTT